MPRPDVPATRPADPPRTPVGELVGWARQALAMVEHRGADPVLTGVSLSSQRIRAGDLYAALPGARAHGADFAADALEAGAVAVLTDPAGAERVPAGVPLLVTEDPRGILGRLSARVYGNPAEKLTMIGVTGTQGKTTTTRLLEGGLVEAGLVGAVIGTVGTRVAGRDVATSLTTPEAPDLHGLFAVMVEQGVDVCAMEVSSHALVLGRVDGVVFDLAVFLNLGRDHLDFHDTVEEYYAAKASLFTPERARRALVNVDDEHGRRLAGGDRRCRWRPSPPPAPPADWGVAEVEASPSRTDFRVLGPGHRAFAAGVPLAGSFNVSNALAAVAAVGEAGAGDVDPLDVAAQVAAGISGLPGVPGRLESVEAGQDFEIVVDYAHKPDAVEAALGALRPLTTRPAGAGHRRRRRPRHRQAAGDGRDRRPPGRRAGRHRRQPPHRGPRRHPCGRARGGRTGARRREGRGARGGRPTGRDRGRAAPGRHRRHRARGRQGPRVGPGGGRSGAPLRRSPGLRRARARASASAPASGSPTRRPRA